MSLIILFSPVLGFFVPCRYIATHTDISQLYETISKPRRELSLHYLLWICKDFMQISSRKLSFLLSFLKKQLTRNIKLTVTRNRLKWQTAILKLCAGCALAADLSSKSMTNSINVTKQLARLVHFSRPTRFTVRLSTAA